MIEKVSDLTEKKLRTYLELPDTVRIEILSGEDSSNGWDKFIKVAMIPRNSPGEMSGKHDALIRKIRNLKGDVVPYIHAAPNFGGGITAWFKYNNS